MGFFYNGGSGHAVGVRGRACPLSGPSAPLLPSPPSLHLLPRRLPLLGV